jgi:hypothetical protein
MEATPQSRARRRMGELTIDDLTRDKLSCRHPLVNEATELRLAAAFRTRAM